MALQNRYLARKSLPSDTLLSDGKILPCFWSPIAERLVATGEILRVMALSKTDGNVHGALRGGVLRFDPLWPHCLWTLYRLVKEASLEDTYIAVEAREKTRLAASGQ